MKKLFLTFTILMATLSHAQIDQSKYDYIDNFSEGLAKVKENGKIYEIDNKGKKIKEIQPEERNMMKSGL